MATVTWLHVLNSVILDGTTAHYFNDVIFLLSTKNPVPCPRPALPSPHFLPSRLQSPPNVLHCPPAVCLTSLVLWESVWELERGRERGREREKERKRERSCFWVDIKLFKHVYRRINAEKIIFYGMLRTKSQSGWPLSNRYY